MAHPAVGIDLGTTYSNLAVINPAGRPEPVDNAQGERLTASAVFFQESGDIVVGKQAVDVAGAYPDRVVRWIKSKIGDQAWSFTADGREYTAIELSAMILRKIKQDAENMLGPIKYAVVTVPAYFDEIRRRATKEAGKLAGLEVLRIINEPTAAAVCYASSGGKPGTILVYDFGGGTFDVSIVKINGEFDVEVIASDGDHDLGGLKLDKTLSKYYNTQLEKDKGVSIDAEKDSGDWHTLVQRAEKAKRTLSQMPEAKGTSVQWRGAHQVNVDITRPQFENLIQEYIVQTKMLMENALSAANLTPDDIDDVLLIGGSTRIPAVKAMLEEKFQRKPISKVNPDVAVSLGAAIQAGSILQERGLADFTELAAERMSKTKIRDVSPHGYGTIALRDVHGVRQARNTIMIKKNMPLPATKKEIFYTLTDGQEHVDSSVTQGEDIDMRFVKVVKESSLKLPAGLPAGSPIEVVYTYNLDGCMECVFTEPKSGESKNIVLEISAAKRGSTDAGEVDFDDLVIE